MLEKRLLALKDKIDKAKEDKARSEGALQQLHQRLKTEFKLNSEAEAEEHLAELREELTTLEQQIQEMVEHMEQEYGL